jgi:adenine/guanine phosphoribosyltransferase-like PRPP-binding protein
MNRRPISAHQRGHPAIILHRIPPVSDILRRCYSHVEARDRQGNPGLGVTNLKRVFGRPSELRVLVEAIAAMVQHADAIASVDAGSAPLAAVVAYQLSLPAVFLRATPKHHFLSYGGDPATNHPLLAGERLAPGSTVHLIDDLVHSGATLASAANTLHEAGLVVRAATCLLTAPPDESWLDTIAAAGIEQLSALAVTTDL